MLPLNGKGCIYTVCIVDYFCVISKSFFQEYVEKIFAEHDINKLSYFELNLETWRQLWRVLEMSDIVLIIVDIRYPVSYHNVVLILLLLRRGFNVLCLSVFPSGITNQSFLKFGRKLLWSLLYCVTCFYIHNKHKEMWYDLHS